MSDSRDHNGRALGLLDWLSSSRCAVVATETTGVYWRPAWKIRSDGDFELILANGAHIKVIAQMRIPQNFKWVTASTSAHPPIGTLGGSHELAGRPATCSQHGCGADPESGR